MRKHMSGLLMGVGVVGFTVLLILSGGAACAAEPTGVKKEASALDFMGKKLQRGASNAGLGWLEVPVGIQEIGNKHGIGAAATWGLLHGSGRAVQRTAVGLFEILTFPFSLTQDNKPMIEPEFVLDKPQSTAASSASDPPAALSQGT